MRAMARMMTDLPVRVRGPGRVYREETDKRRFTGRPGRGAPPLYLAETIREIRRNTRATD